MENLIKDLDIIATDASTAAPEAAPRISQDTNTGKHRKLYIESYGCQMNFSDSEIVTSVMLDNGFDTTSNPEEADLILLNTCAIRENAEQKVRYRLKHVIGFKKKNPDLMVGVLGCMAERLKAKLLDEEKIVDLVVGPDAYRDLPKLVERADDGQKAINVLLSREETYADITPVRLNSNGVSAFVSIMRGCDNMCSFCIVPFTRGRERSRDTHSIVAEIQDLFDKGFREITLLGQNVDSYKWQSEDGTEKVNFAQLLEMAALVNPAMRVRFTTSHPKDITEEVLYVMKKHDNICKYIHLPAQSGSSRILDLMNRNYDREWYLNKVADVRRILGEDCAISTDIIVGFCTETEEDHQASISLLEEVGYDYTYMFTYSERPGTPAAKKYADDVPEEEKKRRLYEIIDVQTRNSRQKNARHIGQVQQVLIENISPRSKEHFIGRNTQNVKIVFPRENYAIGQYVDVLVTDSTGATLIGQAVI